MNVLILTPDAVGSTLLQRMLTIYMQFHQFDRPVINLHELTNGLDKYYSPEFNQELLGKPPFKNWGYYQTLEEIVNLLSSTDHYKTSRLARYHLVRRGDSIDQQIPFYNYLNENFFIIACRRNNVFEHALSMTLNKITKKLNVYDVYEKVETFYDIYKSGVELDQETFVKQLNAYARYIEWSEQYFNISSYFNYEKDIPRLEDYILNLPVFVNQPKLTTWSQNFGISFNDWNKMHYLRSDISSLPLATDSNIEKLLLQHNNVENYQQNSPMEWPPINSDDDYENLPAEIKQQWIQQRLCQEGLISLMDQQTQQTLSQYQTGYKLAQQTIEQMISLGIMVNGPPIKKQTLKEKTKIIKNFDELVDIYNVWCADNRKIASPLTDQLISDNITKESQFWRSVIDSNNLLPGSLPTLQ